MIGITFEGASASGVRIRHKGVEHQVAATREVILSVGAIHSPKLLQLAGIGPASLLRALDIPVRVDAPGVGRDMHEHRTISISYRLSAGGKNASLRGPGMYLAALRYFLLNRGPLSHSTFDVGGFVKTMPGLDRPDGQIGVGLFSFDADGISRRPGMTMFGYFMRPDSVGEIMIRSVDPMAPPYIDANYLSTERDRIHTVALMRKIREIAAQPALASYIVAETSPGAQFISDDDLIEASFTHGTSGYHVAGTCRMGSDEASVVDPQLRVRGVRGLRVVDTSVMPALSGNTNAPAMAIAWRASELIQAAV